MPMLKKRRKGAGKKSSTLLPNFEGEQQMVTSDAGGEEVEAQPERHNQHRQEPMEEVDAAESDAGPGPASATAAAAESEDKKDKMRIVAYPFTDEQEAELAQWWESNTLLYNRRDSEYKFSAKKTRLLTEKAATYHPSCSVDQLRNFLKNMRTQFGRLTTTKSGQGALDPSPRDQWVLTTFSFLKDHIKRHNGGRVTAKVCMNNWRLIYLTKLFSKVFL